MAAGRVAGALALLTISLVLSVGLGEIVLRWRDGPPVHFVYPQVQYVFEPEIGPWMEPDQRAFNHDQPVSINSVGIRSGEHPREVPRGARRLLALGDSQTFGNGLALADTWPAQLEEILNEGVGLRPRWEVLNGGVSGTDTWQHEAILERLAEAYEFDAVVLGLYVNDVTARYVLANVEQRTNSAAKRIGYVLKRSAVFTAIWQLYRSSLGSRGDAMRERNVLTGGADERVEAGWQQVEASLTSMRDRARQAGADLVVAVIPRRDQVSGQLDATAYNERIAELGARLGLRVVDPLPELRDAYARLGDALFIPWDGHNSAAANEVVATALARLWDPAVPRARR